MNFPKISSLFKKRSVPTKSDFSTFFRETPLEEQKRVLLEVVRKANHDQREMVEQYRKLQQKSPH